MITVQEQIQAEVQTMHQNGLSVSEMCRELGASRNTVYAVLSALGLTPNRTLGRPRETKYSDETLQDILRDYRNLDMPVKDVVAKHDITMNDLYRILRDANEPPRRQTQAYQDAKQAALDHACDLYVNSELTIAEITVETGIHQPTLHAEVTARGLPPRNKGRG